MAQAHHQSETRKTMAAYYNKDVRTWDNWIKPFRKELQKLGHNHQSRSYTPNQVAFLIDKIGPFPDKKTPKMQIQDQD